MGLEDTDVVFLVYWMSYDEQGNLIDGFERDDCSLIGVYTNEQLAQEAIERAKHLPGFSLHPETFLIDRYQLNKDYWTSGFGK